MKKYQEALDDTILSICDEFNRKESEIRERDNFKTLQQLIDSLKPLELEVGATYRAKKQINCKGKITFSYSDLACQIEANEQVVISKITFDEVEFYFKGEVMSKPKFLMFKCQFENYNFEKEENK